MPENFSQKFASVTIIFHVKFFHIKCQNITLFCMINKVTGNFEIIGVPVSNLTQLGECNSFSKSFVITLKCGSKYFS